jgi:hypothetical protein
MDRGRIGHRHPHGYLRRQCRFEQFHEHRLHVFPELERLGLDTLGVVELRSRYLRIFVQRRIRMGRKLVRLERMFGWRQGDDQSVERKVLHSLERRSELAGCPIRLHLARRTTRFRDR